MEQGEGESGEDDWLNEITALQSIYDDEFKFDSSVAEALYEALLHGNNNSVIKEGSLGFSISPGSLFEVHCHANITMDSDDDDDFDGENIFRMQIRHPGMTNSALKDANEQLLTEYRRSGSLFCAISQMHADVDSWLTLSNSDEGKQQQDQGNGLDMQGEEVTWVRAWLWFHHIYHLPKRRHIVSQAKQLALSGLSMYGRPGVVVVEGPKEDVKAYVESVRALNWKKMSAKGQYVMTRGENSRIFEGFVEMDADLNALVKHVQGKHCEAELETCLGMQLTDTTKGNDGSGGERSLQSQRESKEAPTHGNHEEEHQEMVRFGQHKSILFVNCRIKPNAQFSAIEEKISKSRGGGVLHVSISAAPREGAANAELVRVIAKQMRVPKAKVSVVKGHKTYNKTIQITMPEALSTIADATTLLFPSM